MSNTSLAQVIAEESIVLLKNDGNLLPLPAGTPVAVFGRTQEDTILSGNGSGAIDTDGCSSILTELENAGLAVFPELAAYYRETFAEEQRNKPVFDWEEFARKVTSGFMYEVFGVYHAPSEEYPVSEEQLGNAAAYASHAIVVLGRNAGGEECDRHVDQDYYLTDSEKKLVKQVCERFENVILILNTNGLVDMGWIEEYPQIKALLFIGIPGGQGPAALANILLGKVCPSGKLAFTMAKRYEDFPSAQHFTWDKPNDDAVLTYESYGLDAQRNGSTGFAKSPVTVYQEDIYVGYRYFDSFGVEPQYPFGFGLSYTGFSITPVSFTGNGEHAVLTVKVCNTGCVPGKQTVQLYLNAHTSQKRPQSQLVGFEKSAALNPGESQTLEITVPWSSFAAYDMQTASYTIGAGKYLLRVGDSSRNLTDAVMVTVPSTLTVETLSNRAGLLPCNEGKIPFMNAPERETVPCNPCWNVTLETIKPKEKKTEKVGRYPVTETLSDTELAALCVGYGPGIPFAAALKEEMTSTVVMPDGTDATVNSHPVGAKGYVSPAIVEKGIYSIAYTDGPAGVGITPWPTEMLMGCCFNKELWYAFGAAAGKECIGKGIEVWLAPAVNLHRNPLCGRNFEYFSEDPLLTGVCGVAIAKGAQENSKVLVCPKHFAANEQETFRRGSVKRGFDASDSILTEQALRELYLKPFQMMVEQAQVCCIMTSFNKVNGTFAGGSRDLCTHILREEWGFRGVVVTDWGDMDIVVDGADAVAAGNDVVMPGGPPVIEQILRGLQEGRLTREELITAVSNLLYTVKRADPKTK